MRFYPFTPRQAMLLLLVFAATGIFANFQQYFVDAALRPFIYVLFLFLLLLAFYPAARPDDPREMARFLAVLLGSIFAVMIIIGEIVIRQNYSAGSLVVLSGAVVCPLAAGWIYRILLWRPSAG
jgi:hypothetical protein